MPDAPRFSLQNLLKTRAWLNDRRRAMETVADRLENANNTYSHPATLGELRTVNAAVAGIDTVMPLLEDDIKTTLTHMEVEQSDV